LEGIQSVEVFDWSIQIMDVEFQLSIFTAVLSIISTSKFEDLMILSDPLVKSTSSSPRSIIDLGVLHKGLDVFFPPDISLYASCNP
jgi:hypothetical protein